MGGGKGGFNFGISGCGNFGDYRAVTWINYI
jgi:hypothetical protein